MPNVQPTNAAVEQREARLAYLNTLDQAPETVGVTDDFIFEDRRRSAGGAAYGRVDAADYSTVVRATWDLGTRPRFSIGDIIAVRGQRSAAFIERIQFDNGATLEQISVVQLDPTHQLMRRRIALDVDESGAAVVELNRLHAETSE